MMMVLDLQESGRVFSSLPISGLSVAPPITVLTPLLNYGRCFLDYPYTLEAELFNSSDLPLRYRLEDGVDETEVVYSTPFPCEVIQPKTVRKLPIEIKAQVRGEISFTTPIYTVYSSEPPIMLKITCIGEGPVIYVTPDKLVWEVCPVLTPSSRTITVANQSLIPAEFECALVSLENWF